MKPSDLFIRGRHFFGFLIPGVMWVATFLLALNDHPLAFAEGGNTFIRSAFLIGISYIVGFTTQTLVFRVIADSMKWYMGEHQPDRIKGLKNLKEEIKKNFTSKLPSETVDLPVPDKDFRSFCKLYVLEHSPTLGSLLLEKEDDINFLVAHIVAGPALLLSWMHNRHFGSGAFVIAALLAAACDYALLRRLYYYLQAEIVYTYEACLQLQLGGGTRPSASAGHGGGDGGDET